MIWTYWWNLTRTIRKKRHIKGALKRAESKIWENEFLKHQLWDVRGNMREQYDWLRERVEGAIRQRAEAKWVLYYAETGDEVPVKDLPIPPREIEKLPDKPDYPPHRFYKNERGFNDKKEAKDAVTTISELERIIEKRQPDLDQAKQQLDAIDQKVREVDGTISGTHELKQSLLSMLKKLR